MKEIEIDTNDCPEHEAVIKKLNEFIKSSVAEYEIGDILQSDLNAFALYNVIFIKSSSSDNCNIESGDWDHFTDYVKGDPTVPIPSSAVKKDVVLSLMSGRPHLESWTIGKKSLNHRFQVMLTKFCRSRKIYLELEPPPL